MISEYVKTMWRPSISSNIFQFIEGETSAGRKAERVIWGTSDILKSQHRFVDLNLRFLFIFRNITKIHDRTPGNIKKVHFFVKIEKLIIWPKINNYFTILEKSIEGVRTPPMWFIYSLNGIIEYNLYVPKHHWNTHYSEGRNNLR